MPSAVLQLDDTRPRIAYTVGATATTAFAVPYLFFDADDLKVYVDDVLKARGTDYTVGGVGLEGGGTVTFLTAQTNVGIVITRDIPLERLSDYAAGSAFKVTALNTSEAKMIAMIQQVDAASLQVPLNDAATDLTLPDSTTRAGYILGFNSDGNPVVSENTLEQIDAIASGVVAEGSVLARFEFTGDGSATSFDTGYALTGKSKVIAYVGGVMQESFTISGDSIVFPEAPADGLAVAGRILAVTGTYQGAEAGDAIPQALGTASAGVSLKTARDDHVHAHGNQAGGSLHAVAGVSAGFMSASDKTKLDGIEAGADVTSSASVAGVGAVMDTDFGSNGLMKRTGSGTYSVVTTTAAGEALLDDADASAQRTTLGLGTMATQADSAVAITGGTATLSRLTTADVRATNSAGMEITNSGGTQVALFGAGGGQGSSFLGTTNIASTSTDYVQVTGGTGTATIAAVGASSNVALALTPKGTSRVTVTSTGLQFSDGSYVTAMASAAPAGLAATAAVGTGATAARADHAHQRQLESIVVAASDETTALTAGTGKVTFRMPYAFTVTAVRASLTTAQTSGSIFTVDINEAGTSILSTKLTIDNTEKTSTTAATAAVVSDTALADDAEITVDIDQIGDGTAKGLKVMLIGRQSA
jgi:hypothetical protein